MKKSRFGLSLCLVSGWLVSSSLAKEGDELIGTPAPGLNAKEWFNSKPLTLENLKGNVVLVRWWTGPECPYCSASSPALNEFYGAYKNQGFLVIGMYHHKSILPLTQKHVKNLNQKYAFQFPVAIDRNWVNLRRWWLKEKEKRWTSVSFLLDREGLIRYIHPGGQYVKGDKDYSELKSQIEKLLQETLNPIPG